MSASPSPAIVELAHGHSIAVTRTESGAIVKIQAPDGLPDTEIEVTVATTGTTLRKRTWSSPSEPPPGARSVPPGVLPVGLPASVEPRLSLQQYASLRAECLAHGDDLHEVRAKYGFDEASDEAEAAAWSRKFARDPVLFDSYKALFQRFRSMPPPPSTNVAARESHVVPTEALNRILTLGEHATMAAELLFFPEETVYAKYELTDSKVREHVLTICDKRLEDPAQHATWQRLHKLAIAELQPSRK
jgi:hypothetical protein